MSNPGLMRDELRELERQRAELSLGAPIAWTIVGGVTAITGGSFLLVGALIESFEADSACDEPNSDFSGDYCLDPDGTPFLIVGAVGLVAGIVVLAIAMPALFSRIDERRALGLRIKELRRERAGEGAFRWGDGPRLARSQPLLKLRF